MTQNKCALKLAKMLPGAKNIFLCINNGKTLFLM